MTAGCAWAGDRRPTIDPRVETDVARGRARVLVELKTPADADAVPSRLAGTVFTLVRRFDTVPFLALEIDGAALAALRAMDDVVLRVVPDSIPRPAGG